LHDTPSQPLFTKGPRAFSSGCVRVEQPLLLRDLLVSPAERARTDELLATGVTHEFRLATPVPVLLERLLRPAPAKAVAAPLATAPAARQGS
ncbi:hypothetical protein SB758_34770, partial [Burkholderia sp. SIMBA_013]